METPIVFSTLTSAQKDTLIVQLLDFDTWARAMVINSKVAHFDESGLRVGKQLQWLLSLLVLNRYRGSCTPTTLTFG